MLCLPRQVTGKWPALSTTSNPSALVDATHRDLPRLIILDVFSLGFPFKIALSLVQPGGIQRGEIDDNPHRTSHISCLPRTSTYSSLRLEVRRLRAATSGNFHMDSRTLRRNNVSRRIFVLLFYELIKSLALRRYVLPLSPFY
jgi:hypothetical protein